MHDRVGDVYSAAFTESDSLWNELRIAGEAENDLFWRLPLNDAYLKQISSSNADLCNTGGRLAGASTAAIFLKQFVVGLGERGGAAPSVRYAHLDIAGSMEATPTTINDYQPKVSLVVPFVRSSSLLVALLPMATKGLHFLRPKLYISQSMNHIIFCFGTRVFNVACDHLTVRSRIAFKTMTEVLGYSSPRIPHQEQQV